MDKKLEQRFRQRTVDLGNSGDPDALSELMALRRSPEPNGRRLAVSAMRERIFEKLRQYR